MNKPLNGAQNMTTPNSTISDQLKTIFSNQCSCTECSSGVSPNAYFYDLLNYSYSNFSIKSGSTYSNIGNVLAFPDFFQRRFMQEMENVPVNCEALSEKICQVRLAVETLWRYRNASTANNSSTNSNGNTIINNYLPVMYELLLQTLNLTVQELRLVRLMPENEKMLKAKGLGIKYFRESSGKDTFDYLTLPLVINGTTEIPLTENNLEVLFGLKETSLSRDLFSTGAKFADTENIFARWIFDDFVWNKNTDSQGCVYAIINYTSGTKTHTISIYKDAARTGPVIANGTITNASTSNTDINIIRFAPQNNSGLSGYVQFKGFSSGNKTCSISLIPKAFCWKLQNALEIWQEQDQKDELRLPIIDPDIISLKDLKVTEVQEGTSLVSSPLNVYLSRSNELTNKLGTIKTERELQGDTQFTQSLNNLAEDVTAQKITGNRLFVLTKASGTNTTRIRTFNINVSNYNFSEFSGIPTGNTDNQIGTNATDISSNSKNIFVANPDGSNVKLFNINSGLSEAGKFNPLSYFKDLIINANAVNKLNFDKDGNLFISYTNNSNVISLPTSKKIDSLFEILLAGAGTTIKNSLLFTYEVISGSHRLIKKDQDGKIVWEISNNKIVNGVIQYDLGSDNTSFNNPTQVALNNGYVFVNDLGNNRVQQFTENGTYVQTYTNISFANIKQVRCDNIGNLYFLIPGDNKIIKLDSNGFYNLTIGQAKTTGSSTDGEFNNPVSLTVDGEGLVYVADKGNNRIQIFSSNGEFIQTFKVTDKLTGLTFITHTVDANNKLDKLVVADNTSSEKCIRIFNKLGNLTYEFNTGTVNILSCVIDKYNRLIVGFDNSTNVIKIYNLNNNSVAQTINNYGTTNQLIKPIDLMLDKDSNLLFTSSIKAHIVKFKNNGDHQSSNFAFENYWGGETGVVNGLFDPANLNSACINSDGDIIAVSTGSAFFTKLPSANDLTLKVTDITNDTKGAIYVSTLQTDSKQTLFKFDNNVFVKKLENIPAGTSTILVDHEENLIIEKGANTNASEVQLFSKDGVFIRNLLSSKQGKAIELDAYGRLYWATIPSTNTFFLARYNLSRGLADIISNATLNILNLSLSDFKNLKYIFDNDFNGKQALTYYKISPKEINFIAKLINLVLLTGSLDSKDWEQLYDVLLMIFKRKNLFSEWIKQENNTTASSTTNYNIYLDPFAFRLTNSNQENEITLNEWRGNYKVRKDWRKLLKSRQESLTTSESAFKEAVNNQEEVGLETLRNLIINDSNTKIKTGFPLERKAEWLSKRLFVDMQSNCCTTKPRVAYYLEILQNIFNSIRLGSINEIDPVFDMRISDARFEQSWQTLSSYATWRSAMFVNFYPENLLIPSLRKEKSNAFSELSQSVADNDRFNPEGANEIVKNYSTYLKDIGYMVPSTSLYTKIPLSTDFKASGSDTPVKSDVVIHFAQSYPANNVYFTITELSKNPAQSTKDWIHLEQLKNVDRVLGAVEIFDEKDRSSKILLLIKRTTEVSIAEIAMLVYDIENGTWEDEAEALDLSVDLKPEDSSPNKDIQNLISSIKMPYDRGGFNAILEEAPVNGFKYKDRLEWDSFTSSNKPKVPALVISISWSRVIITCFLDFKDKKLVCRTKPIYIQGGNLNNTPVGLNFSPDALVRLPDSGSIYSNTRYILLGVDVGPEWNKATPMAFQLDNYGARMQTPAIAPENALGFAGYWFDKTSTNEQTLYTYWHNSNTFLCKKISTLNIFGLSILKFNNMSYNSSNSRFIRSVSNLPSNLPTIDKNSIILLEINGHLQKSVQTRNGNFIGIDINQTYALTPLITLAPTRISPNINVNELDNLINGVKESLLNPKNNTLLVKNYIAEAFYFIPVTIAAQLQKKGYYKESLDWYKLVYNYTFPIIKRKIYYGLVLEGSITENFDRPDKWLNDPFNPHSLALGRNNAYTKFTVGSIVRCLLEYADNEFTKDTGESVELARMLYQTAQGLIYDSGLLGSNMGNQCKEKIESINDLDNSATLTGSNAIWMEQWLMIKVKLGSVSSAKGLDELCGASGIIRTIFGTSGLTTAVKLARVNQKIDEYIAKSTNVFSLASIVKQNRDVRNKAHQQLLSDPAVLNRLRNNVLQNSAIKAQAFSQATAIAPAVLRNGVSVTSGGSTVTLPIRLNILRTPPNIMSISVTNSVNNQIS